jgi:hypothetical protein
LVKSAAAPDTCADAEMFATGILGSIKKGSP